MQPDEGQDPSVELTPEVISPEPPAEEIIAPAVVTREPFWNYTDLALVFGLLFAFSALLLVAVGLLALRYPSIRTDPSAIAMPVQLAFYLGVYLSFWIAFRLRYHQPVFRSLGWRSPRINLWLVGAGGFVLAFVLSALGSLLRTPKIDLPFNQFTNTPWSLALFTIVAVVLAPIFEEMFFRGFIQPLLSRTFGTIAGILITACLFGALHGFEYSWVWQYALFITLAGVVFGWLRERTNSIIPSTLMHGCFNAVSVVALAFGKNI
ncbi:MAG TPA: CPBP family intramembrane glutamic endopeptidase [Bryobacteraceae bacterium]|nr:CPBP family intramembrane glutamic endopeptidase [Bryobacteraceae bacterium]